MKPELFPQVPENIEALSADELREALASFRAAGKAVRDKTADTGDLTMPEIVQQYADATVAISALQARLDTLAEGEKDYEAEIARLSTEAKVDEPVAAEAEEEETPEEAEEPEETPEAETPVEETPQAEVEVEEEPEVERIAASALPALPPTPRRHRAPAQEAQVPAFTASAGMQQIAPGTRLDRTALATAVMAQRERATVVPEGVRENVVVASVNYKDFYPEERKLHNDSSDQEKLRELETLVAAGGICAPPTNIYDIYSLGTAMRPVRDALAQYLATRGGVNVAPGMSIADIDGAVGVVTEANDALGGTFAAKGCQVVVCPTFAVSTIEAIYKCLQFGNFNARTWPELVAAMNDAALVAHARLAENELLDGIDDNSTDATQAAVYGAASSLIYGIVTAAAGMRSRHRMDPNARFRVLLPEWSKDLLLIDLANQQFGRFEQSRAGLTALLRQYGIEPTFYLDTPSAGTTQIIGAQGAGALNPLPDAIQWFMFPEGSFLFLDGGTLDLGIVRDSTLNSTNDYQIFAETFEAVAFVGVESIKVISEVCPDGTVATPTTAITC